MAYTWARQRENQTAQQFALYLADLEDILPPYTEEQRAMHLFVGLKHSLCRDILANGDVPETRRELLAVALRFEGIHRLYDAGDDRD